MSECLVSIILPIYNIKKEYLERCIKSLISQTESNIEIILVDDGSESYIEEICNYYMKQDERIFFIHQKNSGVSVARNNGIKNSRGKYICFVDPDDWVEPKYIESLTLAIESNKADIAMCDCVVYYDNHHVENHFLNIQESDLSGLEKNKILYQLVGKKICDYYPPEVAAGVPWGKIFRKSFLIENNLMFIPGMIRMQDNVFCLYAIENAMKIHYIPECLYCYRKEIGSACFKYNPRIVSHFEKYFDETKKYLDAFNKEKIMHDALEMKQLTSFNSFFNQLYFHKDNIMKYSEVKEEIIKLLNSQRYSKALQNIDYSLLNRQESIFVFLLKYRFIYLLRIIVKLRRIKKM